MPSRAQVSTENLLERKRFRIKGPGEARPFALLLVIYSNANTFHDGESPYFASLLMVLHTASASIPEMANKTKCPHVRRWHKTDKVPYDTMARILCAPWTPTLRLEETQRGHPRTPVVRDLHHDIQGGRSGDFFCGVRTSTLRAFRQDFPIAGQSGSDAYTVSRQSR